MASGRSVRLSSTRTELMNSNLLTIAAPPNVPAAFIRLPVLDEGGGGASSRVGLAKMVR
jgi:hypothetical protein